MLKLELKRIFSKKINVFAVGLALILAVIFSGFAVTSNRYVDESGNASTGIMATRKLTDNRRAWKGTLTEDELGKVIKQKCDGTILRRRKCDLRNDITTDR